MRDNPLHEQVIYESIMDGCVYLGDEFISVISNDKINLDTVTESISGYIINNCSIYGINSESFEIKESSLNDVVSKILEEKRYEYYTGDFHKQLFEGAIRAEFKRRGAIGRFKAGKKIQPYAEKMIASGKKKLTGTTADHFKKAGEHFVRGKKGDLRGAIKQTVAGSIKGGIALGQTGVGYARKGLSKYLIATGKQGMKNVPKDHKTPGAFKPIKMPKMPNVPFLNRKKKQQEKQEEATV